MNRLPSSRVYVDTNVFCDAFEGSSELSDDLRTIFVLGRKHPKRTSELTLAELLGRETNAGWAKQSRFYLDLIIRNDFIDLRPVTRQILMESGNYRRNARQNSRKVSLADSIHGVTAIDAECGYVLTSDRRFFVPDGIDLLVADGEGLASASKALDA